MIETITLYDIPSPIVPGIAWSPNAWKVRYALNYKGLPHKTEWVEYPDIKDKCIELGIEPTSTRSDGSLYYSIPAIYDPNTKSSIADSYRIVLYLERTYPNTPRLMPKGTEALQSFPLYSHAMGPDIPILKFNILPTFRLLNPRSQEFYRSVREKIHRVKLEEIEPKGEKAEVMWKRVKESYDKLDGYYRLSGGPYLMGETLSYVDIAIASLSAWIRSLHGKDSDKWKDIISWNDGRWGRLVESLEKYATIN
ncbi:hypothetical protein AMATHDRAFT_149507 [Amanita thiersii Skay4041]|uniref:GST N-terminal domain-containing protein n=1 Tax=Amanita thiersii Skay4041 TaxID=703135 RepID=A0A2A9NLL1_9AGAR|nr:hypothetical protein AMATHDRAFT_149507 [Amanita thiersii Skay4041]